MKDRKIDQSDLNAAAKSMLGMSVPDLDELIREMDGKDAFAAKVTVAAAKQMRAARLRMGASRT